MFNFILQRTNVSDYLNLANIRIENKDFRETMKLVNIESFYYLDPPYDGTFNAYSKNKFTEDDQIALKERCDFLTKIHVPFLESNSNTAFIKNLYSSYNIREIPARNIINPKNQAKTELLIGNIDLS